MKNCLIQKLYGFRKDKIWRINFFMRVEGFRNFQGKRYFFYLKPQNFNKCLIHNLKKRCSGYQQIYENLANDKFENKSSEIINENENEVELSNRSSNEGTQFVSIEKKSMILVSNYSSDSDTE